MKSLLFLCIYLVLSFVVNSQQWVMDRIPPETKAQIRSKLAIYGGQLHDFRQWLQNRKQQGDVSNSGRTNTTHVSFRWPMRANSNYDNIPSFYTIGNYMDVNRNIGNAQMGDWYCTDYLPLTYWHHEGNDYSLYPFFWRMMNNQSVFACAAHAGIVIEVVDSINNSYNCKRDTNEDWHGNHITVLNPDSSLSNYFHIKTGTALVTEGQYIEEGKLLASIGSSGSSSNPHLHFDLRYYRDDDDQYDYVEPYKKSSDTSNNCNPTTATSWWQDQKTYIEPRLNRIMTHYGVPLLRGRINGFSGVGFCPEEEDAKAKTQFNPGENVVVGVSLSHPSRYDSIFFRIYFPNRNPWTSAGYANNESSWVYTEYLTRTFTLPGNAPLGTYIIQVDYTYRPFYAPSPFYPDTAPVTLTYYSFFTVGCVSTETLGNTTSTLDWGHIVGNDLHSAEIISGRSLYQAGNYIQLTPGFQAQAGCTLKARIKDCNYSE